VNLIDTLIQNEFQNSVRANMFDCKTSLLQLPIFTPSEKI